MEIRPFNFKRQHLNVGGIICLFLFLTGVLIISSRMVFGFAPEEKQPPSHQTRTLKFFIFQNPAVMVNGNSSTVPFDLFIGEKDPQIKDAYIEITGVTNGANDIAADIRATQGSDYVQSFATTRAKSFNLDSFGKPNHFKILYTGIGNSTDTSLLYCLGQIIRSPGTYPFEFKIDVSGADVSAVHARMVITYKFTPPTAGTLPVLGYIISSTVDTGITKGAAYNSLTWKGNLNGGSIGQVGLQIATSDSSIGPWVFEGPDCVSGTSYIADVDTPIPIETDCALNHNNKRYFRYKIIICSSSDCASNGSINPRVDEVVVNWSP
ncbi:MAG: hypothetical protein Q8N37_04895 [bacterium]|nr:hypothetical protein [bacterium]